MQTVKTPKWVRTKRFIVSIICSDLAGRAVGWLYRNRVPFQGTVIDVTDPAILPKNKALLRFGLYESAERRFVDRYIAANLDVVELGSSIGAVSSKIAKNVNCGTRLICVEANPRTQTTLTRNLEHNAAGRRFEVIHAAVAYDAKEIDIGLSRDNLSSFRQRRHPDVERVKVPAITLSNLLLDRGITKYQLVADIEGAEAEILQHDSDALGNCQRIIIELHSVESNGGQLSIEDLIQQIENLGFVVIDRFGPVVVFENSATDAALARCA